MEFFFAEAPLREGLVRLGEEESAHIGNVLRMGEGARIRLTDGIGHYGEGLLLRGSGRTMMVEVSHVMHRAKSLAEQTRLLVAPPKQTERLEWIVEKGVEMGVGAFYLVESQRCERGRVNTERLSRVARAALKQSLGCYLPEIVGLDSLPRVLTAHFSTGVDDDLRAVAHIEEGVSPFDSLSGLLLSASPSSPLSLAIGPEGGFTSDEVAMLREFGFVCVSLGGKRLRVETAAIAGIALAAMLRG